MIYKLKDKRATADLIKMIKANDKFITLPSSDATKYIASGIGNPNALILIDEVEGSIFGFVYATIEEWNGEDVCFVQSCVITPDREKLNTGTMFLDKVNDWCRAKDIGRILFSCNIDEKGKTRANAFEKKYKFDKVAMILSKKVD